MDADLFAQTKVEAPIDPPQVLNAFGKPVRSEYESHRYWLLHELRQWRAMKRNGGAAKSTQKALQKELAKLRRIR